MSSLRTQGAQAVLQQIQLADPAAKAAANEHFKARRLEQGAGKLPAEEVIEIYGEAPMSVAPEVGELLYALTLCARPVKVIEFGTSFGASTIYLAAALADVGTPDARVIACEAHPGKLQLARENLTRAGLADRVELRAGDACKTLADVSGPINLLFLDGLNRLYLPLLRMLEPRLAAGALVLADLSAGDPDQPAYLGYVRDPANGYASSTVALHHGVELTRRLNGLREESPPGGQA